MSVTDETLAVPRPAGQHTPPVAPSGSVRVRQALGRQENWRQLVRFGIVGVSGYALNLVVFTLVVAGAGAHHLVGATLAFVVAVTNNFWWNRHWTFAARGGPAGLQAARYFAVNTASFVFQAALLELLISAFGMPKVGAQALSVAIATPFNFVGNKIWSFRSGVRRVS